MSRFSRRAGREAPVDADDTRVAVVTMVRDEGTVLPLWLSHYADQVGEDNLYIVDDSSEDGSTDDLPCNVLRVPPVREGKFESSRMRAVSGLADGLLGLYDAVVFCDADEFLVPDPAQYAGLRDVVAAHAARGAEAVGTLGFNVVQHLGVEPALDLTAPVLTQRHYAVFVPTMCKPSINLSGSAWVAASHGIRADYRVDPAVFMFHLKFADRDLLHAAGEHRRKMVELDGRSQVTSWRRGGDELVGLLEKVSSGIDPARTPEFVPPRGRALDRLVIADDQRPGAHRAPKGGQVKAMEQRPAERIPARFTGTF
ncbi:glycosyltransferase family 2 protein [Nocardioides terrisoli]|uniref:glycosyltransferase family 2 protein n=1 Tax=Nocardioides terrisoli TaxID=3388267 RepID=UPI00287B99BE|nr:glycosyltransferase family 2 protein [Nocardioides marmorisolisilvae]